MAPVQSEPPTLRILREKPLLLGHLQALMYKVWVPFTLQLAMYCLKTHSKIQKKIQLNPGNEFVKHAARITKIEKCDNRGKRLRAKSNDST